MEVQKSMKIVLEDGSEYMGYGFGGDSEKLLELVFNTSMTGYQEILTDPSYTGQAVVMTYPVIGNYGINSDDSESQKPAAGALVVRECTEVPSNFRTEESLSDFMKRNDVTGVRGVDTRALTRVIRKSGSCKVLITDAGTSREDAMEKLEHFEYASDSVSKVSTQKIWTAAPGGEAEFHVAAVDCGMKMNIVRELNRMGCKVTVLPWNTDADTVRDLNPDGVFFSNGPGNPEDAVATIELMRKLRGQYPIFGICLGHQIMALAYGAGTYKLKFGHRGGNHPVKNLATGGVEMTSQNHSYAVDKESLASTGLEITHINLLDDTVEGIACSRDRAFAVQYHPESAPGPEDSEYLFQRFIALMKGGASDAKKK